jgi:Alginate export
MGKIVFFSLFVILLNTTYSQNSSLCFGLELRPRTLIDNGYKCPKSVEENMLLSISQRTKLNIVYQKEKVKAYLSIQDVRFWGDDNNYKENAVFGNTESLSLHQAWFLIKPTKKKSFKIGRQLFKYDDQRILSSRNWNDYQVAYDAVLFQFNDTVNRLDIGLSWNSETSKTFLYPKEKFKIFNFIRYEKQICSFNFSAIGLLTGNTVSDTAEQLYMRGTYGLNLNYKKKDFKIRSSIYYQNNLNNNGKKINAYCFSIFAKQNLFQEKFNFGIGLDYLSGNDETKFDNNYQNTNHHFNILYGRRHALYGYMDYFSTTPEQGLQNYMFKTECRITKNTRLQIDYHCFLLAENKLNIDKPSIKLNKNIGQEFDFTLKWSFMEEVSLHAGYSFYLMTNSLKYIKAVQKEDLRFPQFAYVMIIVKSVNFNVIHTPTN